MEYSDDGGTTFKAVAVNFTDILGEAGVSAGVQPLYLPGGILVMVVIATFFLHRMKASELGKAAGESFGVLLSAGFVLLFTVPMVRILINSGVNAAPLEAARVGRERGAKIIAITSKSYSTAAAKGGDRLMDLADIVLDNNAPPGDAVLDVPGSELKVAPVSTAIGVAIINAILAETAAMVHGQHWFLTEEDVTYIMSSMDADNNGQISFEEFAKWWFGATVINTSFS